MRDEVQAHGFARLPRLLGAAECKSLVALWSHEARFRSSIDMARHRFGEGRYRYFARPLPPLVQALRRHLYARAAALANECMQQLGAPQRFPDRLGAFLEQCADQGQTRPTPLLLRYESQGYNRLHQDLYGAVAFPFQLTCLLSRPGEDFTGGEFLLVEQHPRQQSRGEAVALERGEGILFPTRERPVRGTRGFYRAQVRHGASRVHGGERHALGIIFHDAR